MTSQTGATVHCQKLSNSLTTEQWRIVTGLNGPQGSWVREIVCKVCQWKNFEDRSITGEDTDKSKVACFFWPTVYFGSCHAIEGSTVSNLSSCLLTGSVRWYQRWWWWWRFWSCASKAGKNKWWFLRWFVMQYFYHLNCIWIFLNFILTSVMINLIDHILHYSIIVYLYFWYYMCNVLLVYVVSHILRIFLRQQLFSHII